MNKKIWDHSTFAELFKYSPKEAFEYRKNMLWDEIPKEYRSEIKEEIKDEIIIETPEDEITDVAIMSLEEKKQLLKDNNVDFHVNLWEKKINILLVENELI